MKKKRNFAFALLGFLFLVFAVFGVVFLFEKNNDKSLSVAFYGLSQDLCKAIQEEFSDNQKLISRFDILAADNLDFGVVMEKYDVFFARDGEIIQILSESAEKIPAKILENVPSSLRNKKSVPILFDRFEIALNKEIMQKTQIDPKDDFQTFVDFLHESEKFAISPFFATGGDDKILLALVGSFVQAIGGAEAYKNLINQMQTYDKLNDFLNTGLNDDGFSLNEVLDMLKIWPKERILYPQWSGANNDDLKKFAEQNQIAAFFTNSSERKKFPRDITEQFEVAQMPVANAEISHCVIATSVSCVLISDNSNAKDFLKKLLSAESQSALSDKTALISVNSQERPEEFGIFSGDANSEISAGEKEIMPDLENAAFQRNRDKVKIFAREIREYLR